MPTTTPLTFDRLCEMDPRLRELERDVKEFARVYRRKSPRCANAAWYGFGMFNGKGFKPRLVKLVGWEREPPGYVAPVLPPLPTCCFINDPVLEARELLLRDAKCDALDQLGPVAQENEDSLATMEAYDVTLRHLYELLPSCRGCLCM